MSVRLQHASRTLDSVLGRRTFVGTVQPRPRGSSRPVEAQREMSQSPAGETRPPPSHENGSVVQCVTASRKGFVMVGPSQPGAAGLAPAPLEQLNKLALVLRTFTALSQPG